LKKAIPVLNKGAKIYFEIHDSQGRAMEELLKSFKMTQIEILKDFNQKIRFAKAIFEGK
jgi:methylase of polypeptide subunit release factors